VKAEAEAEVMAALAAAENAEAAVLAAQAEAVAAQVALLPPPPLPSLSPSLYLFSPFSQSPN